MFDRTQVIVYVVRNHIEIVDDAGAKGYSLNFFIWNLCSVGVQYNSNKTRIRI